MFSLPYTLWRFVRFYPLALGSMVFVRIVWAVQLSLGPYILKIMLDRMVKVPDVDPFVILGGPIAIYLGLYFIMATTYRLYDYFAKYWMIPLLRKRISLSCLEHLFKLSHQFYQNSFAGSLGSKVSEVVMAIPDLLQILIDRFFSHLLALGIAIFTLWQVNPRLAFILIAWSVPFLTLSLLASKHLTKLAGNWAYRGHLVTGRIVDVLSHMVTVRLFAGRKREDAWLTNTIEDAVKAERALEWAYFKLWCFYGYGFFVAQCLNFYVLLQGRAEGWITIGDFALVLSLNLSIIDFLWRMTEDFSKCLKLHGRIRQGLEDIMVTPEIEDIPDADDLVVHQGVIRFENVRFTYPQASPLFEKKSVVIDAGQKVGLVGYSGSGKSTFVNLILRLYDVKAGHIFIDDQDIARVTQDSLHQAIGMIPQDPSLFHRSLKDNIRYGNPEASDEEVIRAAKQAYAHEFIQTLPQGYDSLVGERGVKLSGGQRQRVAIARTILKNAPILILDEATSQLDSVTESYIQESLWEVMEGKTTVVVAHRLSTLLHMDRILVFDHGKIVEEGTHLDLLTKGGLYKTLWDAQVGGFLPDARNNPS